MNIMPIYRPHHVVWIGTTSTKPLDCFTTIATPCYYVAIWIDSFYPFCVILQLSLQDVSRWVNQYLGVGGYSDQLITDLATDMADGITLLRLVQALCKQNNMFRFLGQSSSPHPHPHYYYLLFLYSDLRRGA